MAKSGVKSSNRRAGSGGGSGGAAKGPVSIRAFVPLIIIGVFLVAVFEAPYYFPVPGPTGSQSWEFGFSNTAAQGLIALMLLSLFGWRLYTGAKGDAPELTRVLSDSNEAQSSRSLLYAMGIVQIVVIALLVIWYAILPYTHYGEFTYFIQRVEAAVLGRVPYRDFTFEYGPSMLAVPVGLYRILGGKLPIEAAYLATLILHYAVGYGLLAYLVSRVSVVRYRVLVFGLLAIPFFNLSMGLNYTPLRFTIALAAMFAVRDLYRVTADNSRMRWISLGLAAFLFPIINFSISPEMGLALTLGLSAYFGWFIFGPERQLALLLVPVGASVALAVSLFPRAYIDSMVSFGKGGASFPIFPTVHIVAFLAAAIWIFPRLGVIAIRDRTGLGAFAAGMAIMLGLFILPATGRCDFGHVYFNSLGLFLLALAAVSWGGAPWRFSLLGIFFVIFPLIDQVTFWDNYKQPIQAALETRQRLSGIAWQPDNYVGLAAGAPMPAIHYGKLLPNQPWFTDLPQVKIGVPFGVDESLERFLTLTGRTATEYHIAPYDDLFEPSQLERKIADMRGMDYIFVPAYYLNYLRVDPASQMRAQGEADCKFMSGLLLFPISLDPVHVLFQPNFPLMRFIASEFSLEKQFPGDMLLLKRKE